MFERGQHIYSINHGAEGYDPAKPAPATYLEEYGSGLHKIAFGHVEVTADTKSEGLGFRYELFATREEAEAAL